MALPVGNNSVTLIASARMRYMVIETFTKGPGPVYERARDRGRMLPDGLRYVESWVEEGLGRCFQLMETDDPGAVRTLDGAMGRSGALRGRPCRVVGGRGRPGARLAGYPRPSMSGARSGSRVASARRSGWRSIARAAAVAPARAPASPVALGRSASSSASADEQRPQTSDPADVPAGASTTSPSSIKRRATPKHGVHLVVPAAVTAFDVVLHHLLAHSLGGVRGHADDTSAERGPDRPPNQLGSAPRDRLHAVEVDDAPPAAHPATDRSSAATAPCSSAGSPCSRP